MTWATVWAVITRSSPSPSAPAAASRIVNDLRASPPAMRTMSSSASPSSRTVPLSPRASRTARVMTLRNSVSVSDSSLTTTDRLSNGLITEKLGFSVVAAMKVTSRFSTLGSNASCCDFENRCTSSMNSTVSRPCAMRRSWARASTSRTSLTPDVTADSSSKARPDWWATMYASVVLPTPGGPKRMTELGAVSEPVDAGSANRRNGEPGRSTRDCPITSSSVSGRMRTASGRTTSSPASVVENKSSVMGPVYRPADNRTNVRHAVGVCAHASGYTGDHGR